ncbi:MAG: hypothetical protein ACP5I3_04690 [Thermoproteus sp.]
MPCVSDEEAVRAARKRALGLFSSLRRPEAIAVKFGDDWLVGFVSAKHKDDETTLEVKWAYVDCKGVALERIPPDAEAALRALLEDLPGIIKREVEARSRR